MLTTEDRSLREDRKPKDHLLDVLRTLFRWKRPILITCAIAAIGTAILVLILPVYYQASTSFLVLSPDQSKPELIFGEGNIDPDLFGNTEDVDRILNLAESNALIDHLVDSFHLYAHYDIDSTVRKAPLLVAKTFLGLYEVEKTKRDAVVLALEDKDPVLAAAIVKAAREHIDRTAQELIRSSQGRTISTYQADIAAKTRQMRVLNDTLTAFRRRYGIYDTQSQAEALTGQVTSLERRAASLAAREEAYGQMGGRFRDSVAVIRALLRGVEREREAVNIQLERFNTGVSQIISLEEEYDQAVQSLNLAREKLKQYQAAYQADLPAVMVLEEAEVPLEKSRPLRTLTVLAVTFLAFLFSLAAVLLIENSRDIDFRALYHGR